MNVGFIGVTWPEKESRLPLRAIDNAETRRNSRREIDTLKILRDIVAEKTGKTENSAGENVENIRLRGKELRHNTRIKQTKPTFENINTATKARPSDREGISKVSLRNEASQLRIQIKKHDQYINELKLNMYLVKKNSDSKIRILEQKIQKLNSKIPVSSKEGLKKEKSKRASINNKRNKK
jgi:hypothetical protein